MYSFPLRSLLHMLAVVLVIVRLRPNHGSAPRVPICSCLQPCFRIHIYTTFSTNKKSVVEIKRLFIAYLRV
ncbi:hypothetical protein EV426DRAFT_595678 [Tirmania nivea]|nr:hypothetical protein EV426DRAFT_595678 [Tirmania nivea]